jgi:hypothetical protein
MYKLLIVALLVSSTLAKANYQDHPIFSECDNVGDKYLIVKDINIPAPPTKGTLAKILISGVGVLSGVHVDTVSASLVIAGVVVTT